MERFKRQMVLHGAICLAMAASLLTLGVPVPAAAATSSSVLHSGEQLSAGEALWSPNGRYRAVMQGDGNFVVYDGGKALWSARTNGTGGDRVVMQGDGNLVVYATGTAKWSSRTNGGGPGGVYMQDDGNLVTRTADGRPTWSSRGGRTGNSRSAMVSGYSLSTGEALWSPNGRYRAVMQGDGNFVVYDGGKALWSARTNGTGGDRVVMQGDGNLVVYATGTAKWSSRTNGTNSRKVTIQDDGNLVIRTTDGSATWSSRGGLISVYGAAVTRFRGWALDSRNWNSRTPAGNPGVDADGSYGAQCADLAIAWSDQAGHRVGFDGWDTSSKSKSGWHYVSGNLSQARPGDVVTRVGGVQHVVVVLASPSDGTVKVLQQNPRSPAVAVYSASTTGVIWRLDG